MPSPRASKICRSAIFALLGCGGAGLQTSLEVKETARKPDGVLLEPSPAIPPAEDRGRSGDGVVALRQPITDDAIADVAREYVRVYTSKNGLIATLLTDDAVKLEDNGRSSPKPTLITFVQQKYQQHPQDYRTLQRDVVRAEKLERWRFEDIGPRTDPARPAEMRAGDILARMPLDPVLSAQGDPLFHNTLVLLLRRGPERQLKIAGLEETDSP